MRGKASPVGLLTLTAALAVLGFAASPAKADFGIAKFEALTCNKDLSASGLGNWEDNGEPCLASSPDEDFYRQAAGHPDFGITAFLMNQVAGPPPLPDGFVKELRTELPEGLGVNPEATPQCTEKQLSEVVSEGPPITTKCMTEVPGSFIGVNYLTTLAPGPAPPEGTEVTIPALVHNVEPPFGVPSMAGFNATGKPTLLVGDLDPNDQHISFTIHDIESPLTGGAPLIGSRLVINGKSGAGYLTMPSNCAGPQATDLIVHSHPYPVPPGPELEDSATFETKFGANGCENVPFKPTVDVTVNSATDSPEPATVEVKLPFDPDPEETQTSHLLKAAVTLPEGAGLNPSSANGLVACTDAQFGKGTDNPIACPAASEIGTTEVQTPALPPNSLDGKVYVGQPLSNNPSSGNQFRIFIHVKSERFGVNVRLVGNVFPNLLTGQLTAVVDNNPQAPFTSFKLHLDGGPRGALTTPDTCGPHTTTATFTPWSGTADVIDRSSFTLNTAGYGGPCPQTLTQRRFDPGYDAGPQGSKAGAFSPFGLRLQRSDGNQEVKRVDVNLPPGMVAKLRGLEYCPEASIAVAAGQSGAASSASAPCPDKSFVGTASIRAGSGAQPLQVPGNVYLAGPYRGAPVSLVFSTPAIAGPFDLGTVVVRVALHVHPETAQVSAVSDTIPHVFGGVKLDLRSIDVSIHRKNFTVNPTTCRRPFFVRSDIFGGGGNPLNPAAWSSLQRASRFRATNCRALRFKPRFFARIFGGKAQARRTAHPRFRAIFDARRGNANLRRAAFILPQATILDQGNIRTICTRVQLAARKCPKAAIYGHARARSPLLDGVLKGPVYLTSSDNPLPDLLVDLRGQVNIQLRGVISSKRGRLKTVFPRTPDVAVDKFILVMRGGKNRGLLVNSQNLCDRARFAFLNLRAQNSRRMKTNRLGLNIPACRR